MTEPEQWAVELDERATLAGNKAYVVCEGDDVERGRAAERARQLTIQRAFEERERKLREALTDLHNTLLQIRGEAWRDQKSADYLCPYRLETIVNGALARLGAVRGKQ